MVGGKDEMLSCKLKHNSAVHLDPLTKEYPWYTPYQFAGNTPIRALDLDGLEELDYNVDFVTQKDGLVVIKKVTKKVIEENVPLSVSITPTLDGKSFTPNSVRTLLGRDDDNNELGDFSGITKLSKADLAKLVAHGTAFISSAPYYGATEQAALKNSFSGELDYKHRAYEILGIDKSELLEIDGVVYNANEAGGYIWAAVLVYNGSLADPAEAAQKATYVQQDRADEPNEQKAIKVGTNKGKEFFSDKSFRKMVENELPEQRSALILREEEKQ